MHVGSLSDLCSELTCVACMPAKQHVSGGERRVVCCPGEVLLGGYR